MEYAIIIIVLLVIAVIAVGAWAYVSGSNRNGDRVWDECVYLREQNENLQNLILYRQGMPNPITDKRNEERKLEKGNEKSTDIAPWDIFGARTEAFKSQLRGQDVGFSGGGGGND
jgi:hypothetical protein